MPTAGSGHCARTSDDGSEGDRRTVILAWGDVLYVDDLSTRERFRRCEAVYLDSGHHRHDAHRLHLGAGYEIRSHHFVKPLH